MNNPDLTKSIADMINGIQKDVMQPRDVTADQLFAACGVRANLAIAAALLDVADAIRTSTPGPAVERALSGLTGAVRDGVGRRPT
ncbi:hypothetical protein [Streptomyces chartreusis]